MVDFCNSKTPRRLLPKRNVNLMIRKFYQGRKKRRDTGRFGPDFAVYLFGMDLLSLLGKHVDC